MKAVKIPKDVELQKASQPENEMAAQVVDFVERREIASNKQLEAALKHTAEIKSHFKEVDGKRRSFIDPLHAVVDNINEFFKPALDGLDKAEKILKKKIAGFVEESATKRDEVLASVANLPENQRPQAIEKAEELMPPKLAGLSFRETWTGEVENAAALMDWAIKNERTEFLKISDKPLKEATKSLGRDPLIPGWKAYAKRTTVVTPSKVK